MFLDFNETVAAHGGQQNLGLQGAMIMEKKGWKLSGLHQDCLMIGEVCTFTV